MTATIEQLLANHSLTSATTVPQWPRLHAQHAHDDHLQHLDQSKLACKLMPVRCMLSQMCCASLQLRHSMFKLCAMLQVLVAGDSAGGVGAFNNADAVLRLIE